jgi:hypothetical protein
MTERIVIKRKVDTPDWERLRDAARRAVPLDMILHASEGTSGTFHVAPAGPTLTPEGVESKFILQRIDESVVR